jgi:hypothetical protein
VFSLTVLPPELIDRLRDAVNIGDLNGFILQLDQANDHDPRLAAHLRKLAEGFEHEALLT